MLHAGPRGDGTAATRQVVQTIEYPAPEAVFAGMAWSSDGRRAYASGGGNDKVRVYDVDGQRPTERASLQVAPADSGTSFVTGLALAPDGKTLYAAEQQGDSLAAIDVEGGAVRRVAVGADPYGVAMSPDGGAVYVSNQGAKTVSVVGTAGGGLAVRDTVRVGTHPNKMVVDPGTGLLYVANAGNAPRPAGRDGPAG
jgi:YVTN family beta-propeller protein